MLRHIILSVFCLLILSCVTERISDKQNNIFIGPDEHMVPILIQGYVMGEEGGDDSVNYPLSDVKVSVTRIYGSDEITVTTLTTKRGFFSISPDYVSKNEKKKISYIVKFQKDGFNTVTKALSLPSPEASRFNVVLKGIK